MWRRDVLASLGRLYSKEKRFVLAEKMYTERLDILLKLKRGIDLDIGIALFDLQALYALAVLMRRLQPGWKHDGLCGCDGGFTDATVQANTSYSYTLWAMDFDGNYASAGPYSITMPCTCSPDPRQTGTRPTASYWGGMGEQIDTHSRNLNYDLSYAGEDNSAGVYHSIYDDFLLVHALFRY